MNGIKNTLFHQHLEPLYGTAAAARVADQVSDLLRRWRARLPEALAPRERLELTERDAILITYADQVRAPGEAPLRTLADFCTRRLRGLVSGVHLLPFYPWSSDDGFAVKDFFAVDPSCGTWADVARLRADFDLMFDAVFNHVSAQGEWFQRFLADDPRCRDFFISVEGNPDLSRVVRPRALPLLTEFSSTAGRKKVWTTFSADQVDLNFRNPEVLLAVLEALLFYVSQGARFIRLDAIAFLWKEIGTACLHLPQTHRLIQLLRAVLDEVAPHVLLITETNVPHADNLSYFGDGANEAQMVYNFALPPLVLHSLQTGNAKHLTRWAQSLVLPSDRVTFFNFLASHDGIGLNPARGILGEAEIEALVRRTLERGGFISHKDMPDGSRVPYEMNISWFDALTDPASGESLERQVDRFSVSQAIMLALAGMPGIYFHSLFGSRNDRAAAEATGIPRRINRQKLERTLLELELQDAGSLRAQVFSRYRELLRVRREHPAFHPQARQEVLRLAEQVFALRRQSPDERELVLCLHNVSDAAVSVTLPQPQASAGEPWRSLFPPAQERLGKDRAIQLGPYELAWLSCLASGSALKY